MLGFSILLGPSDLSATSTASDWKGLFHQIEIPASFQTMSDSGPYGGDVRIGDLNGDGRPEFVVYRNASPLDSEDALKPCFLAAFDMNGQPLWQHGKEGLQPARPGPVTLYDIDNDGRDEVICLFFDRPNDPNSSSLAGTELQIRDGMTGEVQHRAAPESILASTGSGANWVHQRFLVCNLSGQDRPQDLVIKLGRTVFALNDQFEILWSYTSPYHEYRRAPAYIPAVGDIDDDGRDEVLGGYYLIDDNGEVLWEAFMGPNMDSVAIAPWDEGRMRAICSGSGQVVDEAGKVLLKLGETQVPHGQELRLGWFDPEVPAPQMMIRFRGHKPDVMLVDVEGTIIRRFLLNESPNDTGMESIHWAGRSQPPLLFNGGVLWTGKGEVYTELPGLPPEKGHFRQGWYHAIPIRLGLCDEEQMVVYNPWDRYVFLYGKTPIELDSPLQFRNVPRTYNARLLD